MRYTVSLKMVVESGVDFDIEADSVEEAKAKVMDGATSGRLIHAPVYNMDDSKRNIVAGGVSSDVTTLKVVQVSYADGEQVGGEKLW